MQVPEKKESIPERIQSLIGEYGPALKYSDATVGKASEFAEREDLHLFRQGKKPQTVAISSLYISGLSNREYRSRLNLANASGLSKNTIASSIKDLYEAKKDVIKKIPFAGKDAKIRKESKEERLRKVDEVSVFSYFMHTIIVSVENTRIKDKRYAERVGRVSEWINKLFFEKS